MLLLRMIEVDCICANGRRETMGMQECMQESLHYGGELHEIEVGTNLKNERSAKEITDLKNGSSAKEIADAGMNVHLKESKDECLDVEGVNLECAAGFQNEYVLHMKSNVRRCFGYECDSMKGTKLSGLYTFYGYATKGVNEMEKETVDSLWYIDVDGALLMAEQGDVPWCWQLAKAKDSNILAASFKFYEERPLAGMFSKGVYFEDETSYWWQQEKISEVITSDDEEQILLIMFDRNGVSYLADIMQNFVFDQGGHSPSALVSIAGSALSKLKCLHHMEHVLSFKNLYL